MLIVIHDLLFFPREFISLMIYGVKLNFSVEVSLLILWSECYKAITLMILLLIRRVLDLLGSTLPTDAQILLAHIHIKIDEILL